MLISVDAMGGDNAPREIVLGCLDAVERLPGVRVRLIGDGPSIERILKERGYGGGRVDVLHTTQVIGGADIPTKAIKEKKDSSLVAGLRLVKEKKTDAFLSCGNTGAMLTGALLVVGRMRGVDRPALAPIMPVKGANMMLIDAGLNTSCKPVNYVQFAQIGSIYMRAVYGVPSPRVGLVNVGVEETKGTEVVREAYARLSELTDINFVGNVESTALVEGACDVAVCDGFVGNIALKMCEAVGNFMKDNLVRIFKQSLKNRLAAAAVMGDVKAFFKQYDNEAYGSTPILGVDGFVFKGHGNSNARAVRYAVEAAERLAKTQVLAQMRSKYAP